MCGTLQNGMDAQLADISSSNNKTVEVISRAIILCDLVKITELHAVTTALMIRWRSQIDSYLVGGQIAC